MISFSKLNGILGTWKYITFVFQFSRDHVLFSYQAQVDKGVELYKEEIEDLKTQLAKADMARMKQSKLFDRE